MSLRHATALVAACALAGVASAAEIAPDDVEIVDGVLDTPLTDKPGDPAAGRDAFVARKKGNCLACHMVTELLDEEQFHGEVGPPLDGIGGAYEAAELRAKIVNPKTELPDTIMPSFYHLGGNRVLEQFQGKTILTAQEVEDVVAYLLTLQE